MLVYRIQNRLGEGPYHDCWQDVRLTPDMLDMQTRHDTVEYSSHPAPRVDGHSGGIQCDEFCAFIDMKSLYNWFTKEEIQIMMTNGYHIIAVEAIIVVELEHQVIVKEIEQ